jgi:hypothetical protein
MFSPTPRRLRLWTVWTVTTVTTFVIATLGLAIAFADRPAPSSSSSSPAMQATAYRFSINDLSPRFIVDRELQAQAAARQRSVAAAELSQYIAGVAAAQRTQFLNAVAAAQQQALAQAAAQHAVSVSLAASGGDAASWAAVARCEEGGVNNPQYGYYGIKEWNGFDGYPTAGSAPQSVQLQWEQTYVGAPPNESGGCHSY